MPWPKGKPVPPERKAKVSAAMRRRVVDGTWNGAAFMAGSRSPEAQAKREATARAKGLHLQKVAAMRAACVAMGEEYSAKLAAGQRRRMARDGGAQIRAAAARAQDPEVNERRRVAARAWALSEEGREQKRRGGLAAMSALHGAFAKHAHRYGNQYFRSSWEVIFARFLRRLHVRYRYEPHVFKLADGSYYVPDFLVFIPGSEPIYVEIKGLWLARSVDKVRGFRAAYPQVRLMVLEQAEIESISPKR